MNSAHLHIVLNHLPLAFSMVSLIIIVVGHFTKNTPIKRLALAFLVLVAVSGAAAYFTGNAAESEKFGPGSPSVEQVETHRKSAGVSWLVGIAAGLVGIAALVTTRRLSNVPTSLMAVAALSVAVALVFFARTANLGGQIMHPEIRADSLSKFLNPD